METLFLGKLGNNHYLIRILLKCKLDLQKKSEEELQFITAYNKHENDFPNAFRTAIHKHTF